MECIRRLYRLLFYNKTRIDDIMSTRNTATDAPVLDPGQYPKVLRGPIYSAILSRPRIGPSSSMAHAKCCLANRSSSITCDIQIGSCTFHKIPWYLRMTKPWLFTDSSHVIYTFHYTDGIIRVHANGSRSQLLWLLRLESTSLLDALHNLIHVLLFGCFCFLIYTKDSILHRYNRWNGSSYLLQTLTIDH